MVAFALLSGSWLCMSLVPPASSMQALHISVRLNNLSLQYMKENRWHNNDMQQVASCYSNADLLSLGPQ